MKRCCLALLLSIVSLAPPALAQELIAPTGPLTPAEQQKKFKLPPGFEIQLVACEPDVHKPMNLNFDASGRLWVTHSLEYPWPAKSEEAARDAITLLSELGADGRAKKIHNFADHLNIPIGVLPLSDREALAWSIPNIWRLTDTDGDGVADKREVVWGPYGFIDTHGNQNALTRWVDGWIYACHGFNNHSQVRRGGTGEVLLEMRSGNSYRFRSDGSAIEQFSWGQVNPFGSSFDPLGNLYSADCHSRPITMLLREGFYQSFGKPDDGLGYAPEMTELDHGGTGIAGAAYCTARQFKSKYQDVLFLGNVVTNRVHCDHLEWHGSSPRVQSIEDFLVCEDQWFRPVDLKIGPDGALYIADFYNKIIGHYEVDLKHPERDRERGRVWRVVYTGKDAEPLGTLVNFNAQTAPQLARLLGHPNLTNRVLATNAILDRFPQQAEALATPLLKPPAGEADDAEFDPVAARAHAVWVIQRAAGLTQATARRLAEDRERLVRTHLVQALAESKDWQPWHFEVVRGKLTDADPFVRRAAATALAMHPAAANVPALIALLSTTNTDDAQLVHATRIALRDQLRDADVAEQINKLKLAPAERKQLLGVCTSTLSGPAALLVYEEALQGNVSQELLAKALPAVAKHIDATRVDSLVTFLRKTYPSDRSFQLGLLRDMQNGLASRGIAATPLMGEVLAELLRPTLSGDTSALWTNLPVPGARASASPWVPQDRQCQDGPEGVKFISSLREGGEALTGMLRSPQFKAPAKLTFWMCGHNGLPGNQDLQQNFVRVSLADGAEIAKIYPPRSDIAKQYTVDLSAYVGKPVVIDIVDNCTLDAYAWIAASRFEPGVSGVPDYAVGDFANEVRGAIRSAAQFKLTALADDIAKLAKAEPGDTTVRLAAGEALLTLKPAEATAPLVQILADANQPIAARQQAAELLGRVDQDAVREQLWPQLKTAPLGVATAIATALARHKPQADKLLAEIDAGRAPAGLLREPVLLDRLKAAELPDLEQRLAALSSRLTPADDRIGKLIDERRGRYLAGKFDPSTGQAVFARSVCANCHRIGETGKNLGPALDGIGNRGLDRVLEDVLDPNRNVDQAFRTTVLTTGAGQIHSGFGLREEGQTLVFFDSKGETVRLPLTEIDERSTSSLSPMPANLSEQIKEEDFYNLVAYLLTLRAKTP